MAREQESPVTLRSFLFHLKLTGGGGCVDHDGGQDVEVSQQRTQNSPANVHESAVRSARGLSILRPRVTLVNCVTVSLTGQRVLGRCAPGSKRVERLHRTPPAQGPPEAKNHGFSVNICQQPVTIWVIANHVLGC